MLPSHRHPARRGALHRPQTRQRWRERRSRGDRIVRGPPIVGVVGESASSAPKRSQAGRRTQRSFCGGTGRPQRRGRGARARGLHLLLQPRASAAADAGARRPGALVPLHYSPTQRPSAVRGRAVLGRARRDEWATAAAAVRCRAGRAPRRLGLHGAAERLHSYARASALQKRGGRVVRYYYYAASCRQIRGAAKQAARPCAVGPTPLRVGPPARLARSDGESGRAAEAGPRHRIGHGASGRAFAVRGPTGDPSRVWPPDVHPLRVSPPSRPPDFRCVERLVPRRRSRAQNSASSIRRRAQDRRRVRQVAARPFCRRRAAQRPRLRSRRASGS